MCNFLPLKWTFGGKLGQTERGLPKGQIKERIWTKRGIKEGVSPKRGDLAGHIPILATNGSASPGVQGGTPKTKQGVDTKTKTRIHEEKT